MDTSSFDQLDTNRWRIPPNGGMRAAAIIFADRNLIQDMDEKVREQICNVCRLPGIVGDALVMPDAHWGYGFPIGGVAAFDADAGGVISAGGVGFDISCGIRLLRTGLPYQSIEQVQKALADSLARSIPAGVGSTGAIRLSESEMDGMLLGGGRWAVSQGYGYAQDLERIEEQGCQAHADPTAVSARARRRQQDEMGTLGSGNHYLEVQRVSELFDEVTAKVFGLAEDETVISIHCGSRGLGHQIGTEFLREMAISAADLGIDLPDRELACAPIHSNLGQRYIGAMRAGINCALANRQILTHLTRQVFSDFFPNTAPGSTNVPLVFRKVGQPVIIGGSMGTSSYILAGTEQAETLSYSSACHGAGRAMSRHQALKRWSGRQIQDELAGKHIMIRSPSTRGIAEEAPGAYKDVTGVVDCAEHAGLARKVCRLRPMICIKG